MYVLLYACVATGVLIAATLFFFLRRRSAGHRSWAAGAWQVGLCLVVAGLVAELCVRLTMLVLFPTGTLATSFDPELGWSRPPVNRVELEGEATEARIAVVGDSVAFGQGVAAEDGMVHQTRLRLGGSAGPVLNAAVSGYGIDQTCRYVKRHLPEWEHLETLVVVLFAGNDLADTAANMRYGHDKPLFRLVDGGLQPGNGKPSRWSRRNLLSNSRLITSFEALHPAFSALVDRLVGRKVLGEDETLGVVRALLEDLLRETADRRVATLLVLVPAQADLTTPTASYRRLEGLLQEHGASFLDILPLVRARGIDAATLFLPGDPWHLSAEGNRVVAGLIAEAIVGLPRPQE